jgi:uncharacterized protein (DUF169 family)
MPNPNLQRRKTMSGTNFKELEDSIRNGLRLKTFPVAVKFLESGSDFPEKTRQPSVVLRKRVTICQAVTMARVYGWTVGLTREDLICIPAMIAFGFSGAEDPGDLLTKLFCEINFHQDEDGARKEVNSMSRLNNDEFGAIVLAPLAKGLFEPDTVAIYGNPAQIMRMSQAWAHRQGQRSAGLFGGKVECSEYLIAPFKSQAPRVVIPGMGDRIFSMTQDEEMVFSLPGNGLKELVQGLSEAGDKIGARYPVTFYQNFQPDFPKPYKILGDELGIL